MTQKQQIANKIEKWIKNNGACEINLDDENIRFFNGGLFQDMNEDWAEIWIKDLDDMIRYLNRLRYFLNENKIKTNLHKR